MGRKSGIQKLVENQGRYRIKRTGNRVRIYKKPGVDGKQLKKDQRFWNSLAYTKGFSESSKLNQRLRKALTALLQDVPRHDLNWRMDQLLLSIRATDPAHKKLRTVAGGLAMKEGQELLACFEFNPQAPLKQKLHHEVSVEQDAMHLHGLVTARDIAAPEGRTHVVIKAGLLLADLQNNTAEFYQGKARRLPLNNKVKNVSFTFNAPPADALRIYVLSLSFYTRTFMVKRESGMGVVGVGW